MLAGVRDTTPAPIPWYDLQGLAQSALIESIEQAAIFGAALVMTWPSSPAGFAGWPEQAIALAGLRLDDGGINMGPIAGEIDRRLRRPA